eukprot:TRINITY_DN21352_c0_g1_i2.p1 TRINITY_DN21352_c0_g1~~TRINITY_DN21352_c0_g1_i2.p1  ORF type:complete len:288 (-),score=81.80 TRINITY_DN21352_c0_g1_i2:176-1039(-)
MAAVVARAGGALPRGSGGSMLVQAARQWRRAVAVRVEASPNPASQLFFPEGRQVLGDGMRPILFRESELAKESLLAGALLRIKGVEEVMLAANHVTVTKQKVADWRDVAPSITLVVSQFFKSSLERERQRLQAELAARAGESEVVRNIRELLETRVAPMVEEDGGSVALARFDEDSGVVWLEMQGSCRDCPKSEQTLKSGIQRMLSHFVPEVRDVRAVGADAGTSQVPVGFREGDRVVFWGGRPGVVVGFDEEEAALVKLDGVEEVVAASASFLKHESEVSESSSHA